MEDTTPQMDTTPTPAPAGAETAASGGMEHKRRPRVGVVEQVSGRKTIRVAINTLTKHEMYGKYLRRRTRLLVHDETNQAAVGDRVEIMPCRPMSKRKSWRLVRVVMSSDNPLAAAGSEG